MILNVSGMVQHCIKTQRRKSVQLDLQLYSGDFRDHKGNERHGAFMLANGLAGSTIQIQSTRDSTPDMDQHAILDT